MILVDTSVWIEFFKTNPLIYSDMVQLLDHRFVYAYDLVFAELFRGVKSKKEQKLIDTYWNDLAKIEITNLEVDAGKESAKHKWHAQGLGLADCCILYAAKKSKSKLWTLDKKLQKVASSYL